MARTSLSFAAAAAACLSIAGCAKTSSASGVSTAALDSAAQAITPDGILQHIKDLSADSMEGRAPATPGEQKAIAYMQAQFKALGLAPGNPDGTYLQNVDLMGYTSQPTASFTARGKHIALRYPDDYIANSRHDRPETNIDNSDIVFVGYGVVAPEYGWDDYKGVDVRGKTILMLVNDPPVRLPNDTALDTTMFKGRAMTYYGRWTYKYEIATEKGAAAAIIVHETGPAGYPYAVVRGSNSAENFDVLSPDAEQRVGVEGWITLDKAKELLSDAGQNFDKLKAAAARKDFTPVTLDAKATFHVKIAARHVQSHNVVAKLEGSDKQGRIRHLHRALGPPRQRHDAQGRPDLQRRAGQRVGELGAARDRQGVHQAAHAPAPLDPLPLRHGRGERSARRQVLRDAPALSARQDRCRHQHGRRQPVGAHQRPHRRRARQLDAR